LDAVIRTWATVRFAGPLTGIITSWTYDQGRRGVMVKTPAHSCNSDRKGARRRRSWGLHL